MFEKYKNIGINNTKYREIKLDGKDNKDKIYILFIKNIFVMM